MVLRPDRVGGRKAVVKQGVAMERGRDECKGGGVEKCNARLGWRKVKGNFFFSQFVLQMFPPCALPLAQEIRN